MQFLRFCVVGGAGFVTDAGVLWICVHALAINPLSARCVSFALALLVTFLLNKTWAFRDRARRRDKTSLPTYVAVQGVGFLCNYAIYSLLYLTLPPPLNAPLLCLTVASAAALIVNYLGVSRLVFRGAAPDAPG